MLGQCHRRSAPHLGAAWTFLLAGALQAAGADRPGWGQPHTRNMVSDEVNLPASFDPDTGRNVKWVAELGTKTYATPVVAGGCVFVGTNNDRPRNDRHRGDRGVMMCLDEKTGRLKWQLVVPKIPGDPFRDCPRVGICSSPTVEGNRVYVVTNRAEVLCLDINGQADGNDGPFREEGRMMAPPGGAEVRVTQTDADVLWRLDMRKGGVGMYPHDSAHSAILIDGNYLYLNTGNGVDNTHKRIRSPDAPSLIVLDKRTGTLAAADAERIAPRIFHCTWSSPSLGTAGKRRMIFFGGGDGVLYAFDALGAGPGQTPTALKKVWWFDCDPAAPKSNIHEYIRNRQVSPSNIKGMPVFHRGRVYVAVGGDIWWGKRKAWLKCVDAGKTGDVTKTAQIWSYELNRHCCSTPSIKDGLVYISDCGRTVHCVDAETGTPYWTHEMRGEMWASTLVADGKVYIGSQRRDFTVLATGKTKRILSSIQLDSEIHASAAAANGVLYIATMRRLYALHRSP